MRSKVSFLVKLIRNESIRILAVCILLVVEELHGDGFGALILAALIVPLLHDTDLHLGGFILVDKKRLVGLLIAAHYSRRHGYRLGSLGAALRGSGRHSEGIHAAVKGPLGLLLGADLGQLAFKILHLAGGAGDSEHAGCGGLPCLDRQGAAGVPFPERDC